MFSRHKSTKPSLQNSHYLFPLMHNWKLEHRKKNLDCNCSYALVFMKMDFQIWVSLHLFSPPTLHPSLPDLIWTGTSLQPCLLFPSLCGEMEKHKSTFWDSSQEKAGSLDGVIISVCVCGVEGLGGQITFIWIFPIIIEVQHADFLLF